MSAPATPAPARSPEDTQRRKQRATGFIILAVLVVLGGGAWGIWKLATGSRYVDTDNAYVGASLALITPQIDGAILTVPIHETEEVKRGDILATLDRQVGDLMAAKANAEYRQAISRVQGYLAGDASAAAQIQAKDAAIATARSQLERAQSDLQRRQSLAGTGAVSGEEVTTAQNAVKTAQAAIDQAMAEKRAAEANLDQQKAISGSAKVESNPEVALAKNAVDAANLTLFYTVIRSPIDGIIVNNHAQIGQEIKAGTVLMSIAPIKEAFVDANFKEAQLRRVRIGQPVELTSDLYGKDVVFHGQVIGIGGGTGAAFAAIPAQNATGNWIKVVQRVPVRISLNPDELTKHPLRVGLSMAAKIDVGATK